MNTTKIVINCLKDYETRQKTALSEILTVLRCFDTGNIDGAKSRLEELALRLANIDEPLPNLDYENLGSHGDPRQQKALAELKEKFRKNPPQNELVYPCRLD